MNMNARAAARLLRVPEAKIYEWAADGVLPSFKVQDQLRFNRVELLEWAAARCMEVAPDLFETPGAGGRAAAGVKLSAALAAGGIHRGVAAASVREALRAVAMLLALPPGVDRESAAALFAAREGVTPVGGGIAIPHARSPVVLPLAEPAVALTFLARPLDVQAKDGRPVGVLFAIFSPTVRTHLDILAKIAYALSNADLHALLDRRASDEEILAKLRDLEAAPPAAARGGGAP
jgi:PTS system nitrogen regulatory IIA component